MQVRVINAGVNSTISDSRYPNVCPWCGKSVTLNVVAGSGVALPGSETARQFFLIFHCPDRTCSRLQAAFYEDKKVTVYPPMKPVLPFTEIVRKLSPMFIKIYEQAATAESTGLDEICGAGYRRSLEFLVKDYVKKKSPEKTKEVDEHSKLGPFIRDFIEDPRVKSMAEKCAWLGNDESHYTKKWADKDMQDLKKLIDLTARFIDLELHAAEYEAEMAKGKK